MSHHTNSPSHSQSYQKIFVVERDGKQIDLTPPLMEGAKHTIVYAKFAAALGIPAKIPSRRKGDHLAKYAKYNDFLYRALYGFVKQGLLEKISHTIDTRSVEPQQRRGVFWRATQEAHQKNAYLINPKQNSKSFAEQNTPPPNLPGQCGFWRTQAIKQANNIRDYTTFVRNPTTHQLNNHLTVQLNRINKMFNEWLDEINNKVIILHNLSLGNYETRPYKTRFTDEGRKKHNIRTYNKGIENSLTKYQHGVFLTLTTDPKLWLTPKGEKFTRHIKVDGRTYHFEAEGKGGSLYDANRNESTAWRTWYEKICQRYKTRVPYIRCVEFQSNGLIHTHVLLFGIDWKQPWHEFAREWGEKYGQGFLNKAYDIKNDGEKWVWKKHKPDDTKGRAPADYLKKYLVKSMYDTEGFYMYWLCNKRFFTLSQNLRYLNTDDEIDEYEWQQLRESPYTYEYVGATAPHNTQTAIQTYEHKKYGRNHTRIKDDGNPQPQTKPYHGYILPKKPKPEDLENPDQNDDENEWLARALQKHQPKENIEDLDLSAFL